jgi:hypothetical protein
VTAATPSPKAPSSGGSAQRSAPIVQPRGRTTTATASGSQLAKPSSGELAINQFRDTMQLALRTAADVFSLDLKPGPLSSLFAQVKTWERAIEDLVKNGRDRLLNLVLEQGEQVTETGTKRLTVDGWEIEARPRKSGLDPKKLEGLLRAKNLPVEKYMTPEITYSVSELGVQNLLREGKMTPDEMTNCHHELAYNLMTPKKA